MMEHDQKSVAIIIYGLLNLFIGSTSDFIGFCLIYFRVIEVPKEKEMQVMMSIGQKSIYVRLVF